MHFAVKNTFLELIEHEDLSTAVGATRRCRSAPPSLSDKTSMEEVMETMAYSMAKIGASKTRLRSNASTATEEDTVSSVSVEDDAVPSASDREAHSASPANKNDGATKEPPSFLDTHHDRITISLRDTVVPRLHANAAAFMPKPKALHGDVRSVLAAVQIALGSFFGIVRAPVLAEGPMGGITTLTATMPADSWPDQSLLTCAKIALLDAAARSPSVFVLGYNAKPFEDLAICMGFEAWICRVPDEHQGSACWYTYQKGFCPRCSSCRWYHPGPLDMMRVIIVVHKSNGATNQIEQ